MYRLNINDKDFGVRLRELVESKREAAVDVSETVRGIIGEVRDRGDQALFDLTRKFDRFELDQANIRISEAEIAETAARCPEDVREALKLAIARITAFHERQMPTDIDYVDNSGTRLKARWNAVDATGIYVPGGLATYPSTLYMTAIPAKVAGVKRIAMTVPTPGGVVSPVLMAAASACGITEIYRVGGAQAVAALAYGTETIAPVDMICGPGNAYVAEAQRQVFGRVGIGLVAGPSEILVVADKWNDPAVIAIDLLSQAEHDRSAQSILITDDAGFADAVEKQVEEHLKTLPKQEIARESWSNFGAVILVDNLMDQAPALINDLAPEHAELAVEEPEEMFARIRHAGSVFGGRMTPEAVGDYAGGPNHVLPTERRARFQSGLNVLNFMKRVTYQQAGTEGLLSFGPAAVKLARAEGLEAHALSVELRLNKLNAAR